MVTLSMSGLFEMGLFSLVSVYTSRKMFTTGTIYIILVFSRFCQFTWKRPP